MANKKKQQKHLAEQKQLENEGMSTTDFYSLKSNAVDRLVNANAETAPEVSDKEIEAYTGKKKFKIPEIIKIIFIKFWFAGATCFFFIFGLSLYIQSRLDLMVISGMALGAVMDLLENNFLRFMEKTEGSSKRYMLVEYKQFWALFLNVAYGVAIMGLVSYIYNLIILAIIAIGGPDAANGFGIEPLLFGVLVTIIDFIFIAVKNGIKKIINDAKKSVNASAHHKN